MKHKALLAFSGGLDTSYCVLWLNSQGHETHTVTVDTGGFSPAEMRRSRVTLWPASAGVASPVKVVRRPAGARRRARRIATA